MAGDGKVQARAPDHLVVDLGVDTGAPARQDLGRHRSLAAGLRMESTAFGEPEADRVVQGQGANR